ncbi:MAG TPA: DUF58 domain-containing protein [Kiritimatiellia bacterium]|nr:DUF58 domain-containing protein [Kiritimatiellia bacterium]HMO98613.1 DUF58 domain-containing protein [Kiritimatiellia bacterium]HMP96359.1 DUF58 domain-containing protein [Kiritimatiellia bacterium]
MLPPEIIKKIRRIQIRTSRMVSDVFAGQYHSVFKGQGMEFQEVREYQAGDDIRSIDWNVTARMGHPFVKKFVEERELTVMLLVDVSRSNEFGSRAQIKRDLAAEVAAVLAFAAIQNNDRVGLMLFTDEVEHFIPPGKGTRHVLRVIRDVLYYQPQRVGTSIQSALHHLNTLSHRKTVAFLISDFLDHDFEPALAVTAKRHDMIAVAIRDQREEMLVPAGLIEWQDAESGRRLLVDTSSSAVRSAFAAAQERSRSLLREGMARRGVDLIELSAGAPYTKELIRFFRKRERRR